MSDTNKVFEVLGDQWKDFFKGTSGRAIQARKDVESLISQIQPEIVNATDLAIRQGGQQTHLNTLIAQANAVLSRTIANFDTFTAASQRDIRVSLVSSLLTVVKLLA